jgi:hypothetical protein
MVEIFHAKRASAPGHASESGTGESPASLLSSAPFTKASEFGKEAHSEIVFDAFIKAVERLEQHLDKETTMLIEHQPITFDGFNHKKRHGLLELSRAMDAMRGLDRDSRSHEPNAPLTQLLMKLQNNLVILQTHLDAVGTIAAIIARAMHDMNPMAPIRRNLAKRAAFDDAANCQLHLDYRRYFGFSLCELHLEPPAHGKRNGSK